MQLTLQTFEIDNNSSSTPHPSTFPTALQCFDRNSCSLRKYLQLETANYFLFNSCFIWMHPAHLFTSLSVHPPTPPTHQILAYTSVTAVSDALYSQWIKLQNFKSLPGWERSAPMTYTKTDATVLKPTSKKESRHPNMSYYRSRSTIPGQKLQIGNIKNNKR